MQPESMPTRSRADGQPQMILRTTLTSPFGRKVRIAARALGLDARIRIEPANTLDENDTLRQQNPLGKMPCLLLADGTVLHDSPVIIEYLDWLDGKHRLVPADGPGRYAALACAALADGILEASLLMVYEHRFREAPQVSQRWLDHQRGKVTRGLAAFAGAPPDPLNTDVQSIGLACALGYLDWRKPVEWRSEFHRLVEWLDRFSKNEPAFESTRATS